MNDGAITEVQYLSTASGVGKVRLSVVVSGSKRLKRALKRQGSTLVQLADSATGRGTDALSILVDLAQSYDPEVSGKNARKATISGGRLYRKVAIVVCVSIKLTRETPHWLLEQVAQEVIGQALASLRDAIDKVFAANAKPAQSSSNGTSAPGVSPNVFIGEGGGAKPLAEPAKGHATLRFETWGQTPSEYKPKGRIG